MKKQTNHDKNRIHTQRENQVKSNIMSLNVEKTTQ